MLKLQKVFALLFSFVGFGISSSSIADELQRPSSEVLEAIRENVNVVKTVLSRELDVKLDLNEDSIKWIDGYINRNRDNLEKDTKERLIDIFGSFLGEAIINNYGGKWALYEGVVGVHLKGESWAFPFSKVEKQMYEGPEDSIYSFYRVVPMVLDGSLSNKENK